MKSIPYVYTLPAMVSFKGKGLFGYTFGPLKQKDLEVLYVECEKGHDIFMISKKITRTYYILRGDGSFTIDDRKYDVSAGMLVEVPPKVEYSYSGKMTLLAFCKPRWSVGNDTFTKWNPEVVGRDSEFALKRGSWLKRLVRLRIFGKSPTNAYLRLNHRLWAILPSAFTALGPMHFYGKFLHTLARIRGDRAQAHSTFFLRNRPELELIRRLLDQKKKHDTLRVAVLGCSTGAEAYSVAWRIKSARPDLKLTLHAMDISKEAVEYAKCGVYSLNRKTAGKTIRDCMGDGRWVLGQPDSPMTGAEIFERLSPAEMEEFFDRDGDVVSIKSWIKEGIIWQDGDAREPGILEALGPQDIVVANNFLCHMDEAEAEACLRNIARLVSPQGYLFVSGIDLEVRTKVVREQRWKPVQDLLEEIHDGDPCLRRQWPCQYAGLEPIDKDRRDWRIRYAAVFQPVRPAVAPPMQDDSELHEDSGGVGWQTVEQNEH